MKIKLFILLFLSNAWLYGQSLENVTTMEFFGGKTFTAGSMSRLNPTGLRYGSSGSGGMSFSFFGPEGVLFDKDLLNFQFGYQFIGAKAFTSDLMNHEPRPWGIDPHKRSMLFHGLYIRTEYSVGRIFQPFVGAAAYLGFLSAPSFDLTFQPQDNFYQTISYKSNSAWGRFNPAISVNGGFRVVFGNDWAVSASYELFVRNVWATRYHIHAKAASPDIPDKESTAFVYHTGWLSQVQLKLLIPISH